MRSFVSFLGGLCFLLVTPLSAQRQPAFVVLSSPSSIEHLKATPRETSVRERLRTTEAQSYEAALRAEKAPLVARMQERGIVVDWQIETILNAVLVQATEEDLLWLRTQAGVTAAEFAPMFHVHLDAAAKLINAPAVWQSLPGGQSSAGSGVFIGILDSGIEQTHPMFADFGFTAPSGFPVSDTAANKAYTNNKIIVARNFVCPASGGTTCSSGSPNLNASDGIGHGTFVASVAAGRSVITPYNTNISGIAPGAYIGNYKVFSSAGTSSSTAVLSAMNAALNDGVNVINYSGGGQPAPKAVNDIYNVGVGNLLSAGVLVVVSAGNCGPSETGSTECTGLTYVGDSTVSSPAELPGLLSAGASSNSHGLLPTFQVISPTPVPSALQSMGYVPSSDPAFGPTVGPAPLVDITSLDSTSLGCNALPAGSLNGSIAVIKRGSCTFVLKVTTAANAGAIAVLFYDNIAEGRLEATTTGALTPSGMLTAADGATLVAFLQANAGAQGQMGGITTFAFQSEPADLVASYSSRGPTTDYNIKPDLVAPGDMYAATQSLLSTAEIYDPSGFTDAEGTSFAAPMTAGSAAVLKAARPTLTAPADIKSALVNSATPITGTEDGEPISVMNMGAGRLNLQAAMNTPLVANPVSASFGLVTNGTTNQTKAVTLKNVSALSDTFTATVTSILGGAGLQVTTTPASMFLLSGASGTLNIQVTTASAQGIFEGFVTLTGQQSGLAIHIPYWVMFGPPAVSLNGITDGAGFGHNVAPGSIITLFGSSLGGGGVQASTIPLPTNLAHSVVNITSGGTTTQAPLFYSSSGQLNAQLPFTALGSASGKVSLEGVTSNTFTFSVAGAAPGIFNYNQGTGVVLHTSNYSLVTAANPATGGEIVAIYCTGLGSVTPAVTTGLAAPVSPLSQTLTNPTVTIGGQPSPQVLFSGLASGFVGLYQVNATIPLGLTGTLGMTMAMGGNTSNSVLISIH